MLVGTPKDRGSFAGIYAIFTQPIKMNILKDIIRRGIKDV